MHTIELPHGRIAYDVEGSGPLVVLAHGMGDSRRSYRFLVPQLVAAGYRVANVDIRGCGDSSIAWPSYTRTDIADDLIAVARHLGGPAVIVGQSISGGAATIAAAREPELIAGVVEIAPFTRAQSPSLAALFRNRRHRAGTLHLASVMLAGSAKGWLSYLDIAIATTPSDWLTERAEIAETFRSPERRAVLQAMTKTSPADAGAQLPNVRGPVLIIEGSADPDWDDPRAEGERIVADLPAGLGSVAVIEGAGHYPHRETPDEVAALVVPFLSSVLGERSARA